MATSFVLSAQLQHHLKAARSLFALEDGRFVCGSYDGTITLWVPHDGKYTVDRTLEGHTNSVVRVICAPPSRDFPSGSVLSASFDGTVRRWDLATSSAGVIVAQHEKQASAVAVVGEDLYTGGWEGKVKMWRDGKSILEWDLKSPVYTVAALSNGTVLCGTMDSKIRVLFGDGTSHELLGHTAQIQQIVQTATGFASCSNDGTVRLWVGEGSSFSCVSRIQAHGNCVFGLAVVGTSAVASVSEDMSMAIHDFLSNEKLQTILHPATVWSVAVLANGDLITGANDGIVRIFTRDPSRAASADEIATFDALVTAEVETRQRELARHQGGTTTAPPPSAEPTELPAELHEPGTRDGEIKIVGTEAFSWSDETFSWSKLGDVMTDQQKQQQSNIQYDTDGRPFVHGRKYDYVFDVQVADGPIQLLGFNKGENPYVAAQRFLDQEELPQHYLEEVADWVIQHVPKGELGAVGVRDSLTGDVKQTVQETKGVTTRMNEFEQFNADGIKRKLLEFNNALSGNDIALNEKEVGLMLGAVDTLEKRSFYHASKIGSWPPTLLARKLLRWPTEQRFPGIDIARALMLHPDAVNALREPGFVDALLASAVEGAGQNNQMLAMRAFANAMTQSNVALAFSPHISSALQAAHALTGSQHPNTRVAVAAFVLNVSIFLLHNTTIADAHDIKLAVATIASELVSHSADNDQCLPRALYALGNVAWRDPSIARHIALLEVGAKIRTLVSNSVPTIAAAARAAKGAIDAAVA